MLMAYLARLSNIAGNKINCGPALTWMEVQHKPGVFLVSWLWESSRHTPALSRPVDVTEFYPGRFILLLPARGRCRTHRIRSSIKSIGVFFLVTWILSLRSILSCWYPQIEEVAVPVGCMGMPSSGLNLPVTGCRRLTYFKAHISLLSFLPRQCCKCGTSLNLSCLCYGVSLLSWGFFNHFSLW